MNFLLDTNFVSEVMKKQPEPMVVSWFKGNQDRSFLSAVTIAEIELGIELLPAGRRREYLMESLEIFLLLFDQRVLAFDLLVARQWARLFADLEKRGRTAPVQDSMIEATALHWNLTIVTRNIQDFTQAQTLNPWRARR